MAFWKVEVTHTVTNMIRVQAPTQMEAESKALELYGNLNISDNRLVSRTEQVDAIVFPDYEKKEVGNE